jgi:hypothetical protein
MQKFSLNSAAIRTIYDASFEVIEQLINIHFAEVELKFLMPAPIPVIRFRMIAISNRLEENNTLLVTTAIHNRVKNRSRGGSLARCSVSAARRPAGKIFGHA